MAVFKFVIGAKNGKSYQLEKDQKECHDVVDKTISDKFFGDFLGLAGYELEITGGSDKDGFPMKKDIQGIVRRRVILTKGVGFKPLRSGMRKRKSIRGNQIGPEIVQINCKVIKEGAKPLAELVPQKPKEQKG